MLAVHVLADGETAPAVTPGGSSGASITDLVARQYRVETYEADRDLSNAHEVDSWLSYFTLPIRTRDSVVLDDLPLTASGDVLTVEIAGDALLACGQVVIGGGEDIGIARAGNTAFEGQDFSKVEETPYGELVPVVGAATQLFHFDVILTVGETQRFAQLLNALRGGRAALWVADDSTDAYGYVYGFLRTGRVYYQDGVHARARLKIQGVT